MDALPTEGLHRGLVPALRQLARGGGATAAADNADSGSGSDSDGDSNSDNSGEEGESSEEEGGGGCSDAEPGASGDEHSDAAAGARQGEAGTSAPRRAQAARVRVHYVLGDASEPQRVPGGAVGGVAAPKIIVHLVDPSGKWTDRGFFAALSRRSPEPAAAYAAAAASGDLALGSSHLVQVSAPDPAAGRGPVFVALLVGIRPAKRATRTRADPLLLQRALERTSCTAAVMGASLHVARIAPQLGSWYAFERTLKRLAPLLGVPTLVYYYRRQPAAQRAQQALAPAPAARGNPTARADQARDAGAARHHKQRSAPSRPVSASARAAPAPAPAPAPVPAGPRFGPDEAVSKGVLSPSELKAWLQHGEEVGLDAYFPRWRENLGFAAAQERSEVEGALQSMHHALAQARQEGNAGEAEALRFFVEFLRLVVERKAPSRAASTEARAAQTKPSRRVQEGTAPPPKPSSDPASAPSAAKRARPVPAAAPAAPSQRAQMGKASTPAPVRDPAAVPSPAKRARAPHVPPVAPAAAVAPSERTQEKAPVPKPANDPAVAPSPAKRARTVQAAAAAPAASTAAAAAAAPVQRARGKTSAPAREMDQGAAQPPQFTASGVYVPAYLRK